MKHFIGVLLLVGPCVGFVFYTVKMMGPRMAASFWLFIVGLLAYIALAAWMIQQ